MRGLPTADDYLPGHGDPCFGVRHYDLDLGYALEGNRLDGDARLEVEVLETTRRLVLDLVHLKVAKVRVRGARLRKHHHRSGRLVLDLADDVPAGTRLSVEVRYSGHPRPVIDKHHGDAGWEELTDGVIVAAQPHGAPTWFPCNDRPDDKATYAVTVRTASGYRVVSNGRLTERRRTGSGEIWSYRIDKPMATYLATVQIGRYEITEHEVPAEGGVRSRARHDPPEVLTAAGAEADLTGSFDQQGAMMAAFTRLFGPYPFATYTAVVTDDDLEIPLESQSLSTFGANFCTGEWSEVRLVAHELAHQWFGNAVTLARWRDLWLHEGFACYAEWLWSEESGAERSCDDWARHFHDRLAGLDQDLLLADPGPALMFDDRVYKRGALALHALRLTVGDDAFFDHLRAWVAEHDGASVTTEHYLAWAGERTGVDVAALLGPWLHERPLPELPPRP